MPLCQHDDNLIMRTDSPYINKTLIRKHLIPIANVRLILGRSCRTTAKLGLSIPIPERHRRRCDPPSTQIFIVDTLDVGRILNVVSSPALRTDR